MVGIATIDDRVRDLLGSNRPAACPGNGVTVFGASSAIQGFVVSTVTQGAEIATSPVAE